MGREGGEMTLGQEGREEVILQGEFQQGNYSPCQPTKKP